MIYEVFKKHEANRRILHLGIPSETNTPLRVLTSRLPQATTWQFRIFLPQAFILLISEISAPDDRVKGRRANVLTNQLD